MVELQKMLIKKKLKKITERKEYKLQDGPQLEAGKCNADVMVYGGGAGGGKTFYLLLEALRNCQFENFVTVIFRRTISDVIQGGGIWDDSSTIYPTFSNLNPRSNGNSLVWKFEYNKKDPTSGKTKKIKSKIKFAHMQHEKHKLKYQGAQIPLIMFDELTHFTRTQFFYMLSRNRLGLAKGVRPYIRATCNPDVNSWVREFLDWWIDPETGIAIEERSGKIRWLHMVDDKYIWADTREEILENYPDADPLSVSFIRSSVFDNQILMKNDPKYLAKLKGMTRVERMQLLEGNWNAKATAGLVFRSADFKSMDYMIPLNQIKQIVRYWDRASKVPTEKNPDPDYTSGTLMAIDYQNNIYIVDQINKRLGSMDVRDLIVKTSYSDRAKYGDKYFVGLEVDPGSAGEFEVSTLINDLIGFVVKKYPAREDKQMRSKPFAVIVEHGNVYVIKASWNKEYLNQLEAFPDGSHDDMVDSSSGAFKALMTEQVGDPADTVTAGKLTNFSEKYKKKNY